MPNYHQQIIPFQPALLQSPTFKIRQTDRLTEINSAFQVGYAETGKKSLCLQMFKKTYVHCMITSGN